MNISPADWPRISALLDEALDLTDEERVAWFARLAPSDLALSGTLRSLLLTPASLETGDALGLPPDFAGALLAETSRRAFDGELVAGAIVGPWRLERELGSGGMGAVWLAERTDGRLKRTVALKFPYAGPLQRQLAERLARERDILASLAHPHIARLYDADVTASGAPYLVLEYVDGKPINEFCAERQLDVRGRLTLFRQVLEAVQYAHARLVIHRDLKPSNILVSADGVAHLLDFGVAKLMPDGVAQETALTQFSGRALTPDYASPEQIAGGIVTTASDVYSLGVVLYELLVGARPYVLKRMSRAMLEEAILEADIVVPSRTAAPHAKQLRGDLDAILLKALRKNPTERYATVDALREDIERHLAGQAVRVRDVSASYRLRKFLRRNRLAMSAVGLVVVALSAGLGVAVSQARIATREAAKARAINDFMSKILSGADVQTGATKPPEQMTVAELLDNSSGQLLASLDDQPDVQAEVLDKLGAIYETNYSDKAIDLYRRGITAADRAYGPDSEKKALFLVRIANALSYFGRMGDVAPAVAAAEAACRAANSTTSAEYASLLKVKAAQLRVAGDHEGSRAALQQSADIFANYHPDDENYPATLMHLAQAHMQLTDSAAALRVADQAVAVAESMAKSPTSKANAYSVRASIRQSLGRFAAAGEDYAAASKYYLETIGAHHPLYLKNENMRGETLQLSGRRADGLTLMRATTDEIVTAAPKGNATAQVVKKLGVALLRDGSFDDALATTARALELAQPLHQPVLVASVLMDRAEEFVGLGRMDDAQQAERDAEETSPLPADAKRTPVARRHFVLGEIALARGQLDAAAAQARDAHATVPDGDADLDWQANIFLLDAHIAQARSDWPAAQAAVGSARALLGNARLAGDPLMQTRVLGEYGVVLCHEGATEEGGRVLDEQLANRRRLQNPQTPEIARLAAERAECGK